MIAPDGIYAITNTATDEQYVGRSYMPVQRLRQHESQLRHGKHLNRTLQAAWNCYGAEAFTFTILELVEREETGRVLVEREAYWIAKLRPAYNRNLPMASIKYFLQVTEHGGRTW